MAIEQSTAFTRDIDLEIVHAVKGRARLRIKSDPARELLPRIASHLRQQAGILEVIVKQTSDSLIVTFDPDIISLQQVTNSLQSFGSIKASTEEIVRRRGLSEAMNYNTLLSLVPPLIGLGIARGLKVSGWQSILTYILAAGVTREVIDLVRGESQELKNAALVPAKEIFTTEILTSPPAKATLGWGILSGCFEMG